MTAHRQPLGDRDGCTCGDPECRLPRGRCILCGNPCIAANYDNEVCGRRACKGLVVAALDAELRSIAYSERLAVGDETCPETASWGLYNEESDGSVEIQREDAADVWESDDEAMEHVLGLLQRRRAT